MLEVVVVETLERVLAGLVGQAAVVMAGFLRRYLRQEHQILAVEGVEEVGLAQALQ
jgi:hypothetical protein